MHGQIEPGNSSAPRLAGKAAVITGSGGGIGREIASRFVAHGARVILADVHKEGADRAACDLVESGGTAFAVGADISNPDDVERLFRETLDRFGRLDVLVNNAGIGLNQPFLDTSLQQWNDQLRVNLTGTFLCAQAAARIMVGQASGRIVNLASISGQRGAQGRAAYGAAKAGVIQLTKVMAVELGPKGVYVNAVSPGPVASPA